MSRRGWPGKPALAAALALHVALATLAVRWASRHEPPTADERPVPVTLVLTETRRPQDLPEERTPPLPRPAAPAVPDPERAAPAAPPPGAAAEAPAPSPPPERAPPARAGKPLPAATKPAPTGTVKKAEAPARERPKREAHEGAPSNAPGVAVYDVVVDASGKIRSITLARSSGTTSFDASGEAMIRNGIGFEVPPADPSQEPRLFTVSIAFTPEER
jgi:TonB family protein